MVKLSLCLTKINTPWRRVGGVKIQLHAFLASTNSEKYTQVWSKQSFEVVFWDFASLAGLEGHLLVT
jgi:hypothetical protein